MDPAEDLRPLAAAGVAAEQEIAPLGRSPSPVGLLGPPRLAVWSSRFAQGEVLALDRARGQLRTVSGLDAVPLGAAERGAFTPGQTTVTPEVRLADGRALSVPTPFTSASFAPPIPRAEISRCSTPRRDRS